MQGRFPSGNRSVVQLGGCGDDFGPSNYIPGVVHLPETNLGGARGPELEAFPGRALFIVLRTVHRWQVPKMIVAMLADVHYVV